MNDQRLNVRNICQQRKDFEPVNKCLRILRASPNVERKNGRSPMGEMALIQRVVGVACQRGVVYFFHLRVLCQKIHHGQGVLHMPFHAQAQRFQPLQENERVHRRNGRAHILANKKIARILVTKAAAPTALVSLRRDNLGLAPPRGNLPLASQSNLPLSTITPPIAVP